jgi:hypothetical protein
MAEHATAPVNSLMAAWNFYRFPESCRTGRILVHHIFTRNKGPDDGARRRRTQFALSITNYLKPFIRLHRLVGGVHFSFSASGPIKVGSNGYCVKPPASTKILLWLRRGPVGTGHHEPLSQKASCDVRLGLQ